MKFRYAAYFMLSWAITGIVFVSFLDYPELPQNISPISALDVSGTLFPIILPLATAMFVCGIWNALIIKLIELAPIDYTEAFHVTAIILFIFS
jgi:hypothetical protein